MADAKHERQEPEPIEAELVESPTPAPASPQLNSPDSPPSPDYDERGVPSFDFVRNRIERRYATSVGAEELAAGTSEARTLEQQAADREKAAAERLEEIRRSLGR